MREKLAKHSHDQQRKSENFDASSLTITTRVFRAKITLVVVILVHTLTINGISGLVAPGSPAIFSRANFLTPRFVSVVSRRYSMKESITCFLLDKKAIGIDPFRAGLCGFSPQHDFKRPPGRLEIVCLFPPTAS